MRKITVSLAEESYNIFIGCDILKNTGAYLKSLNLPKDIFVITNGRIKSKYAPLLTRALKMSGYGVKFHLTIDSEKAKSINNAVRIVENLADYARQKKVTVIALGGGVIGDLAGFIASIYKRGVPLVHIPSTLLAQIDSSIGGKTAIDLKIAKNMVGTFYQPRLVICDLRLLNSLDKKQLRSGLAEAVKYAAIRDKRLFGFLENNYPAIFSRDLESLEHLVMECSRIKAGIVEKDEKEEKGLRTLLNFGHTIGHAIEAAGDYAKYNHGEAVALGMLAAGRISQNMGLLGNEDYRRLASLIANLGLPQEISGIREKDILTAYKLDKKFIGRTNRFVLLKGIGRAIVSKDIPERIIASAVRELLVT